MKYGVAALVGFCCAAVVASSRHATADELRTAVQWAIAIHGGAGGDPNDWSEAKVQARNEGLARGLQTGRDLLAQGGTAIDAVEAVIRVLEDDSSFNAGRGSVLTTDGRAELDASMMDGKSLACGAVAGVTRVKNPISLARRVMTETKHVLLVGQGADEFAEMQNVPLVAPEYFLSRSRTSQAPMIDFDVADAESPHFGTVGCVALDSHGNLAAGTSTGGTASKLPGRVGDSPIVGAGTYAANGLCAVSGTGIGEEFIRHSIAYDIAAQLRYANKTLESAVTEIMRRRLSPNVGGLIAVSQQGEIVMQHNTPAMSCGAADSTGRFETYLKLVPGDVKHVESTADHRSSPEIQITRLLEQQARHWNDGDVDAFMQAYWKSDELTFSSGGEITRGFDATLERYKVRYPNADSMGRLTFSELEFLPLGHTAMQVLGVWKLDRDVPIGGRFTLVVRQMDDEWKIVHDHTSMSPSE